MLRTQISILTVALAVGAAGGAAAQTPRSAPPASSMKSTSGDTEFAQKAATGGKKEVESAKFAAGKAASADVKAFANRLVKDHTAANQELMKIMKDKRIAAGAPSKSEPESWRSQRGADFDRAFVDHAIADHEMDIALFETESKDGTDAELKAWASQKLPTLREHLKMAQDLKSKLQTTTR